MKVLALANKSTLNCQRKYLRWPTQVLSFFRADLTVNDRGQLVKTKKLVSRTKLAFTIDIIINSYFSLTYSFTLCCYRRYEASKGRG